MIIIGRLVRKQPIVPFHGRRDHYGHLIQTWRKETSFHGNIFVLYRIPKDKAVRDSGRYCMVQRYGKLDGEVVIRDLIIGDVGIGIQWINIDKGQIRFIDCHQF